MTSPETNAHEVAHQLLAFCVLNRVAVVIEEPGDDRPPTVTVRDTGHASSATTALRVPRVSEIIASAMHMGATHFLQGASGSHAETAAGLLWLLRALLTGDERELFEERAAVREFEGGLPRRQAELFALFDVMDHASVVEAVAILAAAA